MKIICFLFLYKMTHGPVHALKVANLCFIRANAWKKSCFLNPNVWHSYRSGCGCSTNKELQVCVCVCVWSLTPWVSTTVAQTVHRASSLLLPLLCLSALPLHWLVNMEESFQRLLPLLLSSLDLLSDSCAPTSCFSHHHLSLLGRRVHSCSDTSVFVPKP